MTRGPLASRRRGLFAVDAASLGLAAGPAFVVCDGARAELALAAALPSSLALLALAGAYRIAPERLVRRGVEIRALAQGALALACAAAHALLGMRAPWVAALGIFAGLSLALVPLAAFVALRLLGSHWLERRVLLIGAGPVARQIAEAIGRRRALGLRVAGYVDDAPASAHAPAALHPWLGPVGHLEKVLREFAIERIVVTLDEAGARAAEEALVAARLAGVVVESGVDGFEWLHERLPLEATPRQLFLEGAGYGPAPLYEVAKRVGDEILALVGLSLAAPLLALAALAIRAESEGPALFQQVRVGRHGRPFRVWKLRTMRLGAEPDGPALAVVDDPRVTRVGRVLRRTRLDEVPQLWNVLRGDMSLVGPRPERPEYYDEFAGRHALFRHRLAVRPGVTGWAQVQQGYVNELEGFGIKLSYDLFYLRRRSFGVDARVMWRTLLEVVQLRGV